MPLSPADDPFPEVENRPSLPGRNPLRVAWQRKWYVACGVAVGILLGVLYTAQRPPVYQSSAQVLVVKKRPEVLPMAGGDPYAALYEDYVSTHLVLIRSVLIVEKAVKKRNLGSLPSFANSGDPTLAIIASLTAIRDSKDASTPTNIIALSYRGTTAEECPIVLDAVIESYRDFLDETYRNVNDNTLELINRARDILKQDLEERKKKYNEFRESAPVLLQGKDGTLASHSHLAEMEDKQLTLRMRAAEIDEKLSAIEAGRQNGTAREVALAARQARLDMPTTHPSDPTLEQQLLALSLQEEILLTDYGPDHPLVKEVRKKIEVMRRFVDKHSQPLPPVTAGAGADEPVEAYVKTLKLERASLEIEQRSLIRLIESEQKEVRGLARYEAQDADLRADILRTQQMFDQTRKRLEEISLVRDAGGYDARVISSPTPGGRIASGAVQTLLSGMVLGFLLGVGLAYVVDLADKSFRSAEEIRRRLGIPVVGHIPLLVATEPSAADAEGTLLHPSLCCHHRPRSTEAETFRGIRTALYFKAQGQGCQIIQVTSPNAGDGKSTTIANLAISMAQSGKSILLLDADFRRPHQHLLFGVSARVGLTSLLLGKGDSVQAVHATEVPHLDLAPCGPIPPNPAELLTSPRFIELLTAWRQEYDFILIDTPPLLSVTDPAVVSSRVDGVVLTLRLTKNGRPAAERAREILAGVGARVVGAVVNGMERGRGVASYASDYEYGQEYGSAESEEIDGGTEPSVEPEPRPT
jgi:capsular exopolysaccharide synthesis family protein